MSQEDTHRRHTRGRVVRRWALRAVAVAALVLPASASARVYWANESANTIGRANLDGTGANQSFIAGADEPEGVAVEGGHTYWTNIDGMIGRANVDGTRADESFITGASLPSEVAVDGAHIYWTNPGLDTIGRANLDGTAINQSFITGANDPEGVATDGSHIYWANFGAGTIGRANLDGTGADQGFITGANAPRGVAVDGAHIYWANNGAGTIGRANLDGTGADQSFITGANGLFEVAVDTSHIYWTNDGNTIGRANLDGSGANQSFITGAHGAEGVAVDTLPDTTVTTLGCTPDPVIPEGSVTCTATVSDVEASPIAPGGMVSFTSNGGGAFSPNTACTLAATSASAAACQVTYTPAASGATAVSAAYSGDDAHSASSGLTTITIMAPSRTLVVSRGSTGSGTVSSNPAGINCAPQCTATFAGGTPVTLTAHPATGSRFAGWNGGGCTGTGPCTLTLTGNQTLRATFTQSAPNTKLTKAAINQRTHSTTFAFKAAPGSGAKARFQCALLTGKHAKAKFTRCSSPKRYRHLKPGRYTFEVRATNIAGPDPTPAKHTFTIK